MVVVPNMKLEELIVKFQELGLTNNDLLDRAVLQAVESHGRQLRDDGNPYLEQHIFPVTYELILAYESARETPSEYQLAGGLLHDVIEDDPEIDGDEFVARFGLKLYNIVRPLTKPDYRLFDGATADEQKNARDGSYTQGIRIASFETRMVKLADRLNNLQCVHLSPDPNKMRVYVEWTDRFYLELARHTSVYFFDKISTEMDRLRLLVSQR